MADRCVSVSLVSGTAEERVPCRETRAGFEKMATVELFGRPGTALGVGQLVEMSSLVQRLVWIWLQTPLASFLQCPPFLTNLVVLIGGAGILPDGSGVVK